LTAPRQLALDLLAQPAQGREDFLVSPSNEAAYASIEGWHSWPERRALLIGPPGSGKTHLAAIWAADVGARRVEAVRLEQAMIPEALEGKALVVEDIDRADVDETALFHLLNMARETDAALLLTARSGPMGWSIAIPDLLSRLRSLPSVTIGPPDEPLLRSLLVKLFVDRQLVVDTTVVDYLTRHLDRSFAAMRAAVAALDREALAQHRRITRAMAANVIVDAGWADPSDT
jgi:chromosomal replication initiation ATPase DnaA